jgi:hypothetical protein
MASRLISNSSLLANLAGIMKSVHFIGHMKTRHLKCLLLAILLSAVHAYNDQYAANGNSCYWYVYTVMEVIRTKFVAVQTEGSAFSERFMFAKKMNGEGDVDAVRKLYDTEWAKCIEQARHREVSSVYLPSVTIFELNVS